MAAEVLSRGVPRRVRLEINLRKLADNFREIRRRVAPSRVMAVLKANAYGLGGERVARTLRSAGVDRFGVAELHEALEFAPLGIPIQILGRLLPDEVGPAVEAGIICPLNDFESAKAISDEAVRQNRRVHGELTVDSGMGRLGLVASSALPEIQRILQLPNLDVRGLYSHCSSAFNRHDDYTLTQLARVKTLLRELELSGTQFEFVHMAATDAINNFPELTRAPFNLVRPGINLYGYYDNEVDRSMALQPVVEFKTRLAAVRTLEAGSAIGYGRLHRLRRASRVGTIAAGYADGLPLALSNRGYVLIRGVLCPVLGRISMDYTTVLLDEVPDAVPGDDVVCFGRQGEAEIPLEDWAALKGTHAYDILCSIGGRVERRYLEC